MTIKILFRLLFAGGALVLGPVVSAVSTTDTMSNSATVTATCLTPTTATLAFPNYNPLLNTAVDATTSISVKCTSTTPITSVALNKGTGTGTVAARTMELTTDATKTINYALYTNSARTTLWGDATSGTSTLGGTGAGLNTDVTFTVYGRIPAGQTTAKPGTYSDTITVTVTY